MGFKKDDLVVINDYGMKNLFGDTNNKEMKTLLLKVNSQMDEQNIYVDKMNGIEIKRAFSIEFFRLATQAEIKKYALKKVFI